jgi:hypothetical protein
MLPGPLVTLYISFYPRGSRWFQIGIFKGIKFKGILYSTFT